LQEQGIALCEIYTNKIIFSIFNCEFNERFALPSWKFTEIKY